MTPGYTQLHTTHFTAHCTLHTAHCTHRNAEYLNFYRLLSLTLAKLEIRGQHLEPAADCSVLITPSRVDRLETVYQESLRSISTLHCGMGIDSQPRSQACSNHINHASSAQSAGRRIPAHTGQTGTILKILSSLVFLCSSSIADSK